MLRRCAELELVPELRGEGIELQIDPVSDGAEFKVVAGPDGGRFEALVMSGPYEVDGDQPLRIWKQGYQSWWWSGVTEIEPMEFDATGLPMVGGDRGGADAISETPFTSWWGGAVGRAGGGSLLLGARGAKVTKSWVAFDEGTAWFVFGGRGESITLAPGEVLELDGIFLTGTSEGGLDWAPWGQWATRVAYRMGLSPRYDLPPTGWGSWNLHFEDVTETDVQAALAAMPRPGVVLVDDGWEKSWGDWTANERFPSGMGALAAEIRAAGSTPGLWMAPFYVEASTGLPEQHPDWFVLNEDGEPYSYANFGDHDYRVLDVTHPDAAAWMQEQVRARVEEGWTFLKLDFLYAGALEGQRHEDVTGVQAYARGVELLREAAGLETFIVACGAPMLPSVGFADGYRTGADISFGFDPDPRREYLRWQARATAARSWQNGRWWWNDPDVILMREPFDEVEASGALAAQVVSGGLWLYGDLLEGNPRIPEAEALADLFLGVSFFPEDPFAYPSGADVGPLGEVAAPDDQAPPRWGAFGMEGVTVLLNLSDEDMELEGPGGVELITGERAEAGTRTLLPGQGEIWRP